MKDVVLHIGYNNNLMSVKPIDDIYSDRKYLSAVIFSLADSAKRTICVDTSRSNYEISNSYKSILSSQEFSYGALDWNNLSFCCDNTAINSLQALLVEMWFAFEYSAYYFFVDKVPDYNFRRMAWSKVVNDTLGYVIFKGAESNVLWIGKSQTLGFGPVLAVNGDATGS